MKRMVVLADTHLRAASSRRLPPEVCAALAAADVVVHAGDLVEPWVLGELSRLARPGTPVHAVLGNNDVAVRGRLPETVELAIEGVAVAVVHETGVTAGRAARVRRRLPDADLVIYGHSHEPCDVEGVDGQRLFNPGSPTERRRHPWPSFGIVVLADRRIAATQIVAITAPRTEPTLPTRRAAPATSRTSPTATG